MLEENKSSLESEIKLMKIKEKLKEAEELEDARDSWFTSSICASLGFIAVGSIFYWKKPLGQYWMYPVLIAAFLAAIGFIISIFAYKSKKESEKEVEKLKREIHMLKQRERERERERTTEKG